MYRIFILYILVTRLWNKEKALKNCKIVIERSALKSVEYIKNSNKSKENKTKNIISQTKT